MRGKLCSAEGEQGIWAERCGEGSPFQTHTYFRQICFMNDCMEVRDLDTDDPESLHAQVCPGQPSGRLSGTHIWLVNH